jgi:CRP/FNR family nitrogen fixation transcriptional regulator
MHVSASFSKRLSDGAIAYKLLPAGDAAPRGLRKIVRKGEALFRAGERAECFYKVVSGTLKAISTTDKRRVVQAFWLSGDVFGLDAGEIRCFTAEAVEDSVVTALERSSFDELLRFDASLSGEVLAATVASLDRAYDHMSLLGRKTAEEKVAAFILQMARRHWDADEFVLPMHRADIADYLGLRRETVCRIMSQMAREGVIGFTPSTRIVQVTNKRALQRFDGEITQL